MAAFPRANISRRYWEIIYLLYFLFLHPQSSALFFSFQLMPKKSFSLLYTMALLFILRMLGNSLRLVLSGGNIHSSLGTNVLGWWSILLGSLCLMSQFLHPCLIFSTIRDRREDEAILAACWMVTGGRLQSDSVASIKMKEVFTGDTWVWVASFNSRDICSLYFLLFSFTISSSLTPLKYQRRFLSSVSVILNGFTLFLSPIRKPAILATV